jgi:hypothetical protein
MSGIVEHGAATGKSRKGTGLMDPAPRSRDQRRQDTLGRLDRDTDIWVAPADRP